MFKSIGLPPLETRTRYSCKLYEVPIETKENENAS
jgi:hypothetical protein